MQPRVPEKFAADQNSRHKHLKVSTGYFGLRIERIPVFTSLQARDSMSLASGREPLRGAPRIFPHGAFNTY
jgi:hypothetical protein